MDKRKTVKKIPPKQWELPVSMGTDGHWVTLKEAIEEKVAMLSFGQLSLGQQAELVAKRIESQPEFELAMAGLVNKEHAIQEVRAQSSVGRTLIEIEQRMIYRILEQASKEKTNGN